MKFRPSRLHVIYEKVDEIYYELYKEWYRLAQPEEPFAGPPAQKGLSDIQEAKKHVSDRLDQINSLQEKIEALRQEARDREKYGGREITTVRSLMREVFDVDEDKEIICQVVAQDGTAWNLRGRFYKEVRNSNYCIIELSHPDLKSLENIKW